MLVHCLLLQRWCFTFTHWRLDHLNTFPSPNQTTSNFATCSEWDPSKIHLNCYYTNYTIFWWGVLIDVAESNRVIWLLYCHSTHSFTQFPHKKHHILMFQNRISPPLQTFLSGWGQLHAVATLRLKACCCSTCGCSPRPNNPARVTQSGPAGDGLKHDHSPLVIQHDYRK